jgi:hypothetical protein
MSRFYVTGFPELGAVRYSCKKLHPLIHAYDIKRLLVKRHQWRRLVCHRWWTVTYKSIDFQDRRGMQQAAT